MTIDLRAAFEQVFGPTDWDRPREWDGAPEGPAPDEYVSESEAQYQQQRYDQWLERES